MANPMYGQNKFDNSADYIVGDDKEAYIKRNVITSGATTDATSLTAAQSGSLIVGRLITCICEGVPASTTKLPDSAAVRLVASV